MKLSAQVDQLEIKFIDTGIGISPKDLPHILNRFFQADSSTTRVAQGTGIGLAHTQELLKMMEGNISFESEPGKGTTVLIRLPIRNDEILTENNEITLTSKPYMPSVGFRKKVITESPSELNGESITDDSLSQVLLIEDNPDVVEYLRSCLENEYHVGVAYNGKTGVEYAVEHIPDFIISDVMMPEMDGFQVCDTLKNDERTSHIPIILLTAKADAVSRLTGLRRGADAYIAKPFNPEELMLVISMLLENRRRMSAHFARELKTGMIEFHGDALIAEAIKVEDAFMKKVNAIMEDHYTDENFSLPQLCREIGMSRSQLFRKMKAVADIAPSDLIRSYRLNKAKTMLENGDVSVAEVTYQVGFKDPSYFSKLFQEEFGVMPSGMRPTAP